MVRFDALGLRGFSIIAPAAERDALITRMEAAGAAPADAEAARVVGLENGVPRYGEDITDRNIPHETRQLDAVHFQKGCYIGQEIVERVRARGGVHRFLMPLEIDGEEPVPAGAKVEAAGKDVGEITSAAFSPARGAVVALGYLRRDEIPPGAALTAAGRPARTAAIPPPAAA